MSALGIAAGLLAPLLGVAAHRALVQRRSARRLARPDPLAIAESSFVQLGGLAQWIEIRGQARDNPLLLIVHGGPGAPYSVLSEPLRAWESSYTLVQWDQRGAGRTYGRNPGALPESFAQLARDGLELSASLAQRFGVPLILLGSSAGSITALHMARARPELFAALVVADLNAGHDPARRGAQRAAAALRARGAAAAARKLEALAAQLPEIDLGGFDQLNRLLLKAAHGVPDMVRDLFLPALYGAPDWTLRDVASFMRGQRASMRALLAELTHHDARTLAPELALPVLVLQGAQDYCTPIEAARDYVEALHAPHKQLCAIEHAGHMAAFARPELTLRLLEQHLLPLLDRPLGRPRS